MNDEDDDKVVEEVVLQHTNNNKTEYISSAELVEVGRRFFSLTAFSPQ